DELHHAGIAEIALTEIEHDEVLQHQKETLVGRFVEAELLFELLDEFGVEALGAAVLRGGGINRRAALRTAPAEVAALAGAGDTGARAGIGTRKLRDHT